MNAVRYLLQVGTSSLILATMACANRDAAFPREPSATASSGVVAPSALPSAPAARRQTIQKKDFALTMPDGYADVSATFQEKAPQLLVVLQADEIWNGYQPTIVIRKAPIPGGSFADPSTCSQTGKGLVMGGTEAPGTGGTLVRAEVIDGPLGRTCQIQVRAPQGVALITELHRPGNTPLTPQDLWLMTCNYADGDKGAEARCRSTLAGFRLQLR
jgi:hypothetical protein